MARASDIIYNLVDVLNESFWFVGITADLGSCTSEMCPSFPSWACEASCLHWKNCLQLHTLDEKLVANKEPLCFHVASDPPWINMELPEEESRQETRAGEEVFGKS